MNPSLRGADMEHAGTIKRDTLLFFSGGIRKEFVYYSQARAAAASGSDLNPMH